jgi:hypothetical protein
MGRRLLLGLALLGVYLHACPVYLRADRWNDAPMISEHPERLWAWTDPPFLSPILHRR